ncbi:MAG TPA: aldehyde dehydrogenase family protein [Acidobacteriaceae bacterium]|nr:aldehyde dehydrogenase family protein [Acidobacteriaceae bacterium]
MAKVWIGGEWQDADAASIFHAENPSTGEKLAPAFPVSRWSDCEKALAAAADAAHAMEEAAPERIAAFLEAYALGIAAGADRLAGTAQEETGLPFTPRLRDVELPRTIDQLRQAAKAAREGTWRRVIIDRQRNLRSCLAPIGPVVIFGPNNFPFAYNAVSGGDFAAAMAAGNPVIAKAHPLHPHTSQLLAEEAARALAGSGLPEAAVQMLYHVDSDTGLKLVSDSRVGAVAFTGSKGGGLALKRAADGAGRPIYLEMSSLNPVVFLPNGMKENASPWARELADSCTAGSGQFCTRPNLVFVPGGEATEGFLRDVRAAFEKKEPHALLSFATRDRLDESIGALRKAGAAVVTGGKSLPGAACRYANTLLRVSGETFLRHPAEFQREAFGNEVLAVTVETGDELLRVLEHLEGNLTASVYSAADGGDEELYKQVAPVLRRRSGRMLNDKMPTGVAVSPAMNHGGPYPATGHPGFTAVGLPTSIARFTALQCYDNVREERLPRVLQAVVE